MSTITREDKFNTSVIGINAVKAHIESKPETLCVYQMDEQKNILVWEYLTEKGIKTVTVVVKSSTMTVNYSCIVYDSNKLTPYPVCLKLVKKGFQPDYVAHMNVKNGYCDLIPGKKLAAYIYSQQATNFRLVDSKSCSGDRRNDKLALVPMSEIKKSVGCITRKLF